MYSHPSKMAQSSRFTFSASAARAAAAQMDDDNDLDEEPGETIDSAPPLRVGEEREIGGAGGLKKKLLRRGSGWETPALGDEAIGSEFALLRLQYFALFIVDFPFCFVFLTPQIIWYDWNLQFSTKAD